MQKIILFLLAFFARIIISFHKPKIIWVTWTVWKTTVTGHVYWYLSQVLWSNQVGYSPEHYNWEYGLPLTIIGAKSWWKNPFKWIFVFFIAITRFFRPYPRYLVLEYWIDHPMEMDFLLSIAVPDIAILTEVAPNHIEQFWTFDRYREEKLKFTRWRSDLIIHDSLRNLIEREAFYYGTWWMSEIDISHVEVTSKWTSAKVHFQHHDYTVSVPFFGSFHIVNILPLFAIAELWNLPIDNILAYIKTIHSESGRSSILPWINNSTIIDWTYNWWYLAIYAWLSSMRSFLSSHNLIFIIWDMRELWSETVSMHQKLADDISNMFPHKTDNISFYLVWPHMKEWVYPILSKYFNVEVFTSSRIAGDYIATNLIQSELPYMVYAKGSQNTIFLEEAVERLLLHKSDVSRLCRQTPEWKRKKDEFFNSII